MNKESIDMFFGEDHAAIYDERWKKLSAITDTLHLFTASILADQPEDANVLCVGVGTGVELLFLAKTFPKWRFTAVDPSQPMLKRCEEKAKAAGIESRCVFHHGFVDSFPEGKVFNVATAIFVSHFITQREERADFFRNISKRMVDGGTMINADLAPEHAMGSKKFESLLRVWALTHDATANTEGIRDSWSRFVALSSPSEMETLLSASGFSDPIPFFQALFIRAWYSRIA